MSDLTFLEKNWQETETLFKRIWKNDDEFYARYRIERHQFRTNRRLFKHIGSKPNGWKNKQTIQI